MKATLSPSQLNGTVSAPPSKSCMHRALICAAAADRPTKIIAGSYSEDTKATIECLKSLGAKIEYTEDGVMVYPIQKQDGECVLNCRESGSTLRFMLPFAATLGRNCTFVGAERLGQRPLLPLCEVLNKNGVATSYGDSFLPCRTEGKLSGKVFEIPGNISSQFITGLLFALGVTGGGEIKATTPIKSGPYIDITIDIMKKFGVNTEKTENGSIVPEGQMFTSPEIFAIEGDWSNGAFWLVAGAISSENGITCTSLCEDTFQGDSRVLEILSEMGADITYNKNSVIVKKSRLKAITVDCADIPDIVPILCVAATTAEGTTVFKNIQRLRDKESDRVKTTVDMIRNLGGKIDFDENNIYVTGNALTGGVITSANDHRIAMSGAIASLLCTGDVTIDVAEAVGKSYPDFYEKFTMLGGKCSELYDR